MITVLEIKKIVNGQDVFIDTIYNNFPDLWKIYELSHTKKEIRRLINDPNFISLFAYDKNKIVGYILGEKKQLNDGRYIYYISYFYVAPAYRNNKLGSQLMKMIINKCNNWGIRFISLTCDFSDKKVMRFYKRFGFAVDPILRTGKKHDILTLQI